MKWYVFDKEDMHRAMVFYEEAAAIKWMESYMIAEKETNIERFLVIKGEDQSYKISRASEFEVKIEKAIEN